VPCLFKQIAAFLTANRHLCQAGFRHSGKTSRGENHMSSLDFDFEFDFDTQIAHLESEWRQVYEDSIVARAEYQTLAATPNITAKPLDIARERLERVEALKASIMVKIERLEDRIIGHE
jgi:predicted HD phosphohydrolase